MVNNEAAMLLRPGRAPMRGRWFRRRLERRRGSAWRRDIAVRGFRFGALRLSILRLVVLGRELDRPALEEAAHPLAQARWVLLVGSLVVVPLIAPDGRADERE